MMSGKTKWRNPFSGLEGAFHPFGGVTEEVLLDNDRGLVVRHDRATREVEFNARLHVFARHWRFRPRACARPIGRGRRAKTSAASVTSRRTRLPADLSKAGQCWRRTLGHGPSRSPQDAGTAIACV
jgi:transposase